MNGRERITRVIGSKVETGTLENGASGKKKKTNVNKSFFVLNEFRGFARALFGEILRMCTIERENGHVNESSRVEKKGADKTVAVTSYRYFKITIVT